jgi:hypothetical protein
MRATALLMLLVFPTSVLADELRYIPKWSMCGDKACYDFDQAKKLLELDADLHLLLQQAALLSGVQGDLKAATMNLRVALEAQKNATLTLEKSNEILNKKLVEETTRANKAEAKPGPFPAWAIGAGVGIAVGVVAGVILGVYVAK